MCSCRFHVFMGGGEFRILFHCHLEPESVNVYLNVGICLTIPIAWRGNPSVKGRREALLFLSGDIYHSVLA